ncbi:MAG: bifunctional DNA primase/polymerase [Egibacteraceae bacterium]
MSEHRPPKPCGHVWTVTEKAEACEACGQPTRLRAPDGSPRDRIGCTAPTGHDRTAPDSPGMLDAALGYARRGIPVFPCHHPVPQPHGLGCSCGDRRCSRPAKHPLTRHGLNDATTDPKVIRARWRRWPDANIGIPTGVAFDVLDLDGPAGVAAARKLVADHNLELTGPVVRTGSGGWHYLLTPTGQSSRVGLLEGVDWRGTGGYVIAPPSRHASSGRYRWVRGLDDTPLPPAPQALRDLLTRPQPAHHPTPSRPVIAADGYGQAALAAETARLAKAPLGTRNATLNRAAFRCYQLAAAGLLDPDEVTAQLTRTARALGLGDQETRRTLGSASRAGLANPRTVHRSRGVIRHQPLDGRDRHDGRSR